MSVRGFTRHMMRRRMKHKKALLKIDNMGLDEKGELLVYYTANDGTGEWVRTFLTGELVFANDEWNHRYSEMIREVLVDLAMAPVADHVYQEMRNDEYSRWNEYAL